MKRVVLLGVLMLVPAVAGAQMVVPAVPPAPPAPIAPQAPPPAPLPPQVPPAPLPPPAPIAPIAPAVVAVAPMLDRWDIDESVRAAMAAAQDAARSVDVQALRDQARAAAQVDTEAIRAAAERAREDAQWMRDYTLRNGMPAFRYEMDLQEAKLMSFGMQDSESSIYSSGLSLLSQRQYRSGHQPLRPHDLAEGRARRRRLVLEGVRAVQARQERRSARLHRRAAQGLSAEPVPERREGARGRRPQAASRDD